MMTLRLAAALTASVLLCAPVALSAQSAASYENLQKVKSKRFDQVFLLPEVDFRPYAKVMIDTPEVAFEKNWLRDYNRDQSSISTRLSDSDADRILKAARTGVADIYKEAFTKAGYQVVTAPGADVMRVRTAVVNLTINAPDTRSAARQQNYAPEAGRARLIVEARDSTSGALLGLAVDDRYIGDSAPYVRNSVTNQSDFELAFKQWAKITVDGIDDLKSISPVDTKGKTKSKS